MCNPILQAKLLNRAKTDLNVVIGLCVGHDSLFYKYAEALTTTPGNEGPGAGAQSGGGAVPGGLLLP